MKKAVFFDIDGTLWDGKMQVPQSNVLAVRKLRENGNYAFICSGRCRAAIQAKELLEGIGFDGILAGCGTYIEYSDKIIYERNLSREELSYLLGVFKKHHTPIVLEGKQHLYANLEDFHGNLYLAALNESLDGGFLPLDFGKTDYDVSKLTAYFMGEDLSDLRKELSENYELLLHTQKVFEVLPKGFSKASGIKWICEYLNIAHEDTYAFGDSVNDLEMLSFVKYGIAMGNATETAKEAADYVTDALWDDGIRHGLEHFSLI